MWVKLLCTIYDIWKKPSAILETFLMIPGKGVQLRSSWNLDPFCRLAPCWVSNDTGEPK